MFQQKIQAVHCLRSSHSISGRGGLWVVSNLQIRLWWSCQICYISIPMFDEKFLAQNQKKNGKPKPENWSCRKSWELFQCFPMVFLLTSPCPGLVGQAAALTGGAGVSAGGLGITSHGVATAKASAAFWQLGMGSGDLSEPWKPWKPWRFMRISWKKSEKMVIPSGKLT